MVVRVVEEGALCCVAEDENPTDHFLMTAVSVFRLILVLFSGALIRLKNLLELKLKGRYQILFPSCAAVLLSLNVKQCGVCGGCKACLYTLVLDALLDCW